MSSRIDEFSRAIGSQSAQIEGLKELFEKHCADDDRRHSENLDALKNIVGEIKQLNTSLGVSKAKAASALAIASGLIAGLGWIATTLATEAVHWLGAHLK